MTVSQQTPSFERARNSADKAQRRRAILDAARTLFAERGLSACAMADGAARAGGVRGPLSFYGPRGEGLLLWVLEELLGQWLDELGGRTDAARPRLGARKLAQLICDSLLSYEPLG